MRVAAPRAGNFAGASPLGLPAPGRWWMRRSELAPRRPLRGDLTLCGDKSLTAVGDKSLAAVDTRLMAGEGVAFPML